MRVLVTRPTVSDPTRVRDVDRVTLAISAAGTLFTAMAAAAALQAARVSGREARARSEPFIAVGIPRRDLEQFAMIVPLKNLGLGPARFIALQLSANGVPVSVRVAPGLAPMESEDWVMFIQAEDVPFIEELGMEGSAEDASGGRHPLHFMGSEIPRLGSDGDGIDDAAQVP